MVITVFSSFGYCRIGRLKPATAPISRISRLTTADSTGRRMKRSVKLIGPRSSRDLIGRDLGGKRETAAVAGRHRGAVEQHLVLAQRHHPVARLDAAQDGNAGTDMLAGRHPHALGLEDRLSLAVDAVGLHDID